MILIFLPFLLISLLQLRLHFLYKNTGENIFIAIFRLAGELACQIHKILFWILSTSMIIGMMSVVFGGNVSCGWNILSSPPVLVIILPNICSIIFHLAFIRHDRFRDLLLDIIGCQTHPCWKMVIIDGFHPCGFIWGKLGPIFDDTRFLIDELCAGRIMD